MKGELKHEKENSMHLNGRRYGLTCTGTDGLRRGRQRRENSCKIPDLEPWYGRICGRDDR